MSEEKLPTRETYRAALPPHPARTPQRWHRRIFWSVLCLPFIALGLGLGELNSKFWRLVSDGRNIPIAMPHGMCWVRLHPNERAAFISRRDGTLIDAGAPILEMHLRNLTFLRLRRERPHDWEQCVREDFAAIVAWLKKHPEVKGLYGMTALWWIAQKFGAELRPCKGTFWTRFVVIHMTMFVFVFHLNGARRARTGNFWPFECWISRKEFIRRYGR